MSALYVLYHTGGSDIRDTGIITYISIDPGIKNLALRIEERSATHIKTLVYELLDVSEDYIKQSTLALDKYKHIFNSIDYVIVEKQMPKARMTIIRLYQHILTYFTLRLENNTYKCHIVEISSKLKKNIFKDLPGTTQKKQSVNFAIKLLQEREDTFSLSVLDKHKKKKDDLADTICQLEALIQTLHL